MKEKILQVVNFINKDVLDENESKKTAVVLRILALVMCVYFLILMVIFYVDHNLWQLFVCMICILVHLGVFYLSYKDCTHVALWFVHFSMVIWIVYLVASFGWDIGVQHFLFVLVIFYYLSSNDRKIYKIMYAVLLCALRLFLYRYCNMHAPTYALGDNFRVAFQTVNTIVIFLDISIIALVFSMGSQEMEQKLVDYNKKLKKLASVDELTGLYNRRNMMERLEGMENQKIAQICSVAIGDIDFFKKVNDVYGHECGDLMLQEMAALMNGFMQGKGCVARWGGEEFLLLFEGLNGDEAHTQLFHLLKQIRALSVMYGGQEVKATMTFGLTEYIDGQKINAVIKEADDKLYQGKASGRNRVVF